MPSTNTVNERIYTLIGAGAAAMNFVVFLVVGVIAVESTVYGGIMGLFAGVGSYFFIPWFMQLSAIQDSSEEEIPFLTAVDRTTKNIQLGVFGFGLELAAIIMLVIAFTLDEPDLVTGTAGGLTVAVAVYLIGDIALNRR